MSNKKRRILLTIVLFTITVSAYLIYKTIDTLMYRTGRPHDILYIENVNSDVGYTVYLKPNDFFDTSYVDNTLSYITSLVQYIKTTFTYDYEGSKKTKIEYDYYIKATMTTSYINTDITSITKPLWTKDFMLLDHKKGTSNNAKFKLAETLNIGIDYYNSLLETFAQSTNILLDSKLDVTLFVDVTGQLENGKPLYETHQLAMTVPLGVKAFDITSNRSFPEHQVIYSKEQKKIETSYMIAIMYITLLIISLWITFYLIKMLVNRNKNVFEEKLSKILKDYDERIITVTNFVKYDNMQIVDVDGFNELLNLSNETMDPIIYWPKDDRNHIEAWFLIIKDKIMYRFVMAFKK